MTRCLTRNDVPISTRAASSGKRNIMSGVRLSVSPSVCLSCQHIHCDSTGDSMQRGQRTFRPDNKEDRHNRFILTWVYVIDGGHCQWRSVGLLPIIFAVDSAENGIGARLRETKSTRVRCWWWPRWWWRWWWWWKTGGRHKHRRVVERSVGQQQSAGRCPCHRERHQFAATVSHVTGKCYRWPLINTRDVFTCRDCWRRVYKNTPVQRFKSADTSTALNQSAWLTTIRLFLFTLLFSSCRKNSIVRHFANL